MTRIMNNMRRSFGFSLVELLVALVLGLFVVAGVIQVYVSNKQAYRVNDAMERIQENARFAMHFLTRDIRMAGYRGCAGREAIVKNTLNPSSDYRFNFDIPIEGHEASGSGWAPSIDTSIITSPASDHDILVLRGSFGGGVKVTGQPSSATDCTNAHSYTADLKISDASLFDKKDIVMATNCSRAAIFQITNINSGENVVHNTGGSVSPGNSTKDLGACFAGNGELVGMETRIYYIRDNAIGEPSLYRIRGAHTPEELVEGVEDMQILYGVDTDGDLSANKYDTADHVSSAGEWNDVVSVRVQLLLRSLVDNVVDAPRSFTFNGETVTPTDKRIRRVFTSTASLRNRTP